MQKHICRNKWYSPIVVHFNDSERNIPSLHFCGIEKVTPPPAEADHKKKNYSNYKLLSHFLSVSSRPSNINTGWTLQEFITGGEGVRKGYKKSITHQIVENESLWKTENDQANIKMCIVPHIHNIKGLKYILLLRQ